MTDLTEQWKKGELTQDFYYVRSAWSDETEIRYVQNPECGDVYEEIIAPVPSYDDYMTMKDCVRKEFEAVEKYAQIKELLQELLDKELIRNCDGFPCLYMIDKINEVLR